jgi:two-component system chemotaxis response regulator CheB
METEVKIAREDNALESGIMKWGEPSIYACPECHGVLLQLKEGSNVRFRCHTGHAYSVDTLLADFTEKTEESLWSAIRAVEETVLLMQNLSGHFREHHHDSAAEALMRKAAEAQERAKLVRQAAMRHENLSAGTMEHMAKEE